MVAVLFLISLEPFRRSCQLPKSLQLLMNSVLITCQNLERYNFCATFLLICHFYFEIPPLLRTILWQFLQRSSYDSFQELSINVGSLVFYELQVWKMKIFYSRTCPNIANVSCSSYSYQRQVEPLLDMGSLE